MQLHSESAMELDFDEALPQASHAQALLRWWKWFKGNQLIRLQKSTNMIVGFVIAGAIVLVISYLHTTGFFNDPQQELLSFAGFDPHLSPAASPLLILPGTPNLSPSPEPPPPVSLSTFNSTTGNVSMITTKSSPPLNPRSESPPTLSRNSTPPPLNPTQSPINPPPALTPPPPPPLNPTPSPINPSSALTPPPPPPLNATPSPLNPTPVLTPPPLNLAPPPPAVDAGGNNSNSNDWKVVSVPSPAPEERNDQVVYYQSMSVTWHHMSDKELLRKASEVDAVRRLQLTSSSMQANDPTRSKSPQTPRIAYMFLTRGVIPFAPLWDRYFRGHQDLHSIYVHANPRYMPAFPPHSPFFRRFVPSKEVRWGRLSLYEAERRLLANALLDPTNAWFLLLSDSCIPLDTFPNTYKYITESRKSFIEAYVESGVKTGRGQGRSRLYRNEYQQMAPEVTRTNFRKGSQWFQINRDLAAAATTDTTYYPKFAKHFCTPRPVCYIDEHYLQTLAFSVRPRAIAYRTLTYFSFPHNGPHPRMWDNSTTSHRLINWFREGHNCTYNGASSSRCYFFARKFHPNALDILLGMAQESMGIP